ncbi:MAG: ABC transporter ATP-binding protein [Pseudomonadota bacterium]
MSDTALELRDVSKTFKRGTPTAVPVLEAVSLALKPGEVVALVAPSGAGKSTLLHIAGLLETPDAGAVLVAGRDLTRARDRERTTVRRRDLGFVYQFHHLLPEFSALENVMLPQLADGGAPRDVAARAKVLIETVGLKHRTDHRPTELSGGEQQRIALCRALANSPKVLLADEPTGNLDPETSAQVFEALMSLARRDGLAALIATHNLELAARMDRQVQLRDRTLAAA